MHNRVIVIENWLKNFQLQLQLLTLENSQLQLQQNCVINYNFVNYNYNFSKPYIMHTVGKSILTSASCSYSQLAHLKSVF